MTTTTPDVVLLGGVSGGLSFVPLSTPLLRLNYYDGKFLRADDLTLEQRAHREYMQYSNRAGGPGVVYGFDVTDPKTGYLTVSEGLAVDPMGRLLLLPQAIDAPIAKLIDEAHQQKAGMPASSTAGGDFAPCEAATSVPVVPAVTGVDLYLVCLAHAEALCGHEEVFGRLCDEACVTATDRPYRHEGVVVLLAPLVLRNPLPASSAVKLGDVHLRSRVASAYFADEWDDGGSLLSAAGLRSPAWCLGAPPLLGQLVPLAVLGWKATTITVLDMWTARRERMETPPRRYWQGRMEMRPWPVFLAQVLQFQCQLRKALSVPSGSGGGEPDPCADERALLDKSTTLVETLLKELSGLQPVDDVDGTVIAPLVDAGVVGAWKKQVLDLLAGKKVTTTPARVLVDGGIVEIPAAGYLPVDAKSARSLQSQVQDLMGPGVDLRFCAVRRDQIAHELERAQHMNRISLLRGIDDATKREAVDILVPDGEVVSVKAAPNLSFALDLALGFPTTTAAAPTTMSLASALTTNNLMLLGNDEIAAAGRRMLDSFNRAAATDPKVAPIRGAARLQLGQLEGGNDRSITLRTAAAGPVGTAGSKLIRTILAVPDSDLAAVENRMSRAFDDTPSGADGGAESGETTNRMVAAMADNLRSRHRADLGRLMRTERAPAPVSLDEDPATQVAAVWTTLWVATNPFGLKPNQSTAFTLTLDLFVPARRSPLLEARLDGRLDLEKASRTAGVDMLVVQARGFVQMLSKNVSNAPRVEQKFDVPLVLLHGTRQGKEVVTIRVNDEDVVAAAIGTWGGSPLVFTGSLGSPDGDLSEDPLAVPLNRFISATAMQDATLAQPDNVHRKTAVDALTILQGARPFDPSFFETALRQLFPALEPDRVEIQPTTDWVLFRRRRREECAGAVQPKVDLVDVVTWTASSTNREEAWRWAKLLQGGQGDQVPWQRVGTVHYDTEGTELRSPASALRNEYKLRDGGPDLIFAGYAENGSGPAVAIGRTEAAVDALVPDAALALDGAIAPVDHPPADQMEDGTVASIFFISHRPEEPEPVRDCVDLYLADLRQLEADDAKMLEDLIRHGDQEAIDGIPEVAAAAVRHVVTVTFVDGALDDAEVRRLEAARADIVPTTLAAAFDVDGVGWMPGAEWSDEQHVAGEARIMAVLEKLMVEGQAHEARFDAGDGCPLRIYVIVKVDRG